MIQEQRVGESRPKFPFRDTTHFVVVGHDIYHEILATSFDAITIAKCEITDTRLLKLIENECPCSACLVSRLTGDLVRMSD